MHPLLQFFEYEHLPSKLAEVSKPFCELAKSMMQNLPANSERDAFLHRLLEAKDCAVRCQKWGPADEKPVFPG